MNRKREYCKVISSIALTILVLISGCAKDGRTADGIMLFDFERDSDLDRFAWKCRSRFQLSSEYKNTGSRSLRFEFHPAKKIGFSTGDVPQDWSIYNSFDFWVYNPSPAMVPIWVKVNRRGPSGVFIHLLNRHFTIEPGVNTISIRLDHGKAIPSGSVTLQKVDGFFLYMQDIPKITVLYFDTFRLTKSRA